MTHKEKGDGLYTDANYNEAFKEYKQMIDNKEYMITPFFNNRLLACARKTKKLENYLFVFDLFSNINPEVYDLKIYNEDQFKLDNTTTYLWLLYDLLKADDFNVNLYLQEILKFKEYLQEEDKQVCAYYLSKLLFKNEITNRSLLTEFIDSIDYTLFSKELQNVNDKLIASAYEDAGYKIAKHYQDIGDFEKSNMICDDLLQLDNRISKYKTHILNLQSQNHLRLGDDETAIYKKDQAIQARDDWYLYHQKGLIFYNNQDITNAGKYLTLALLKNNQKLEYINKLLQDLKLIYEHIGNQELIDMINSLIYYIREKNNWHIKQDLELVNKIKIDDNNYQKIYDKFLDDTIKVMLDNFVPNIKSGVISNINYERRFGFIKGNDNKFYHFTTTSILYKQKLAKDDKVVFELVEKFNYKKEINELTCEYVYKGWEKK